MLSLSFSPPQETVQKCLNFGCSIQTRKGFRDPKPVSSLWVTAQNPGEDSQVSMDVTSPPLSLHDNGFSMVSPDPLGTSLEEMEKLKEELRLWKIRVEDIEKAKADLFYCKLRADAECDRAEKELAELKEQERQRQDRVSSCEELLLLKQENTELKKEIEKLKEDLEEHSSQDNPLEIKKKVAEMRLKFSHLEEMKDDGADTDMDTHCVFGAATKTPFRLNQNQALLTFEDEEVAQRLTKMSKHCVNLDDRTANVTVKPFELDMGFQFELHVTVSGRKINVSDIPELPIPEDWIRDKLELHFYKTKQAEGGGEIENVTYNKGSGTAVITFLKPGASYNFVGCTKYPFCAEERWFIISVSPHFDFHLRKFQPHCRVSKKTILLKGIPEVEEDEESVQDMIEIHFQKPSNGGGEIEGIKYLSRGAAYVCFEEDTGNATSEITGDS
ncbi:N-myc-interactor isoform X3 [Passer montanus]|uniref:N-myc-interactor isoform X3 n=1 Tax=Passer montanus TaxID=9160 RepID=UPI0019620F3C|nr:N-myc-interactor isoform X3 [Passer montanus]